MKRLILIDGYISDFLNVKYKDKKFKLRKNITITVT